jgi:hypothetical protein
LFLETSQQPIKTTFLNGDTSQTRTETLNLVEEDASESVNSHQDQTQFISDPEEINSGTVMEESWCANAFRGFGSSSVLV